MRRRDFLHRASQSLALGAIPPALACGAAMSGQLPARVDRVDRRARLARHAPIVRGFEAYSALSVGNGAFAFTADATGLQTFPDEYEDLPLATQAEWGWHSYPNTAGIGVFLIWQQPHPIYLAELVYRADARRAVLERYSNIVFASAEFMASYPYWDPSTQRYVLGPPLIPAQESHPPATTFNPTFELAYWSFGLETAQRWRERLGLSREPHWDRVLRALSPVPMRDGLYVSAESAPTTFTDPDQRRDHPTLLGAYGFIGSPQIDRAAMQRTLHRVMDTWQWEETWGWDYPLVAMTAARLGEPAIAVDALLMATQKNRYHPNGHNYQRPGLTIYLPGNGGLLSAVAMMAAGWDGAPRLDAPGFPRAGWTVRAEGLRGLP